MSYFVFLLCYSDMGDRLTMEGCSGFNTDWFGYDTLWRFIP